MTGNLIHSRWKKKVWILEEKEGKKGGKIDVAALTPCMHACTQEREKREKVDLHKMEMGLK